MASTYDPTRHHRRSIRLKGHNYAAPGIYFITLCIHHQEHILGKVVDGAMELSPPGQIVSSHWHALPKHHPNLILDAFVVMPNHIHGILILTDFFDRGARSNSASANSAGNIEFPGAIRADLANDIKFPGAIWADSANDIEFPGAIRADLANDIEFPGAIRADFANDIKFPGAVRAGLADDIEFPDDLLAKPAPPDPAPPDPAKPAPPDAADSFAKSSNAVRAGLADDIEFPDDLLAKPAPPDAAKPAPPDPAPATHHAIPEIIRGFKTFSARRINQIRKTPGTPVWQRNYYDRILRDRTALQTVRRYIENNPKAWSQKR